jgi:hypothetical protein
MRNEKCNAAVSFWTSFETQQESLLFLSSLSPIWLHYNAFIVVIASHLHYARYSNMRTITRKIMKAPCNVKAMAMMLVILMVLVAPTVAFAFVVKSPPPARLSMILSASKNKNTNGFFSSFQLQQPSNGTFASASTSFSRLFASPTSTTGGDEASAAAAITSTPSQALSSSLWNNTVSTLWKQASSSPLQNGGDAATRQQQQQTDSATASSSSSLTLVVDEWTRPIQSALDSTLDGWVLSYADLRPDHATTLIGASFLATNLAYLLVGLLLTVQGDAVLGLLTDVTAVASFMYHYTQLEAAGQMSQQTVRLALLTDYACAAVTMGTASVYLLSDSFATDSLPMDALVAATVSLAFLGLSWVNEKGRPYMFYHSLWHFFSAYAGYLIGTQHVVGGASSTTASLSMDIIISTASAVMAAAATAAAAAGGVVLHGF